MIKLRRDVKISDCNDNVKEMFQHAKTHTSVIYAMNYVFYSEAQKAYDEIEELGLCKHKVNMYRNRVDKRWKSFQIALQSILIEDGANVMLDMMVHAHANIEEDILKLKIAVHNSLLKHNVKNAGMVAQLITAICLGDILESIWKGYFSMYKKKCGADFSKNFAFADMKDMYYYVRATFDIISDLKDDMNVISDKPFTAAYNALANRLIKKDFLEDAARTAIGFSKSASEKYKDDIMEIEEEKNKPMIDKLSTKYKVTHKKQKTC